MKNTIKKIKTKNVVIEIFGLGYVGFPLAIKLASSGFIVRGIDTDEKKIERYKKKQLSESEIELYDEFTECLKNKKFFYANSSQEEIQQKIGIICVPTPLPTKENDSNVYVLAAVENFLKNSKKYDVLILESSIEIGTTEKVEEIIKKQGFATGNDFGLAFCPERIDPQNKKWHLENIPRIIYSTDDSTFEIAKELYRHVNDANLLRVSSPKVAEIVKSFENTFRLVNISLVNELAILCDKLQINVNEVINFAATKPFGYMPFYSGAGAGGHCIPKDPTLLLTSAKKNGSKFQTIENALQTNLFIPKYIAKSIEDLINEKKLRKTVLICGVSYKPDIEDMRDSPGFKILKELNSKGFQLAICDTYYKKELEDKYKKENNIENIKFEVIHNIREKENFSKFDCICIVQHHTKMKHDINKIYQNSEIPLIYDCQNKLNSLPESSTILQAFGA